jgi:hypothetical protein
MDTSGGYKEKKLYFTSQHLLFTLRSTVGATVTETLDFIGSNVYHHMHVERLPSAVIPLPSVTSSSVFYYQIYKYNGSGPRDRWFKSTQPDKELRRQKDRQR